MLSKLRKNGTKTPTTKRSKAVKRGAGGTIVKRVTAKTLALKVSGPERLVHDLSNDIAAAHLRLFALSQSPGEDTYGHVEASLRILTHAQELVRTWRNGNGAYSGTGSPAGSSSKAGRRGPVQARG
jgi:hypothetical protein